MLTPRGRDVAAELDELQALWLDLQARVDELAGEHQHYYDFFQRASEAYVLTDEHGTIEDANGAAVDVLLHRRHYLRGKPLVAFIALERRAEFRRRLRALAVREPQAARCWRTIFVAPELRIEVILTARPIERAGGVGGFCWRLEAAS